MYDGFAVETGNHAYDFVYIYIYIKGGACACVPCGDTQKKN